MTGATNSLGRIRVQYVSQPTVYCFQSKKFNLSQSQYLSIKVCIENRMCLYKSMNELFALAYTIADGDIA
jgi:hypothetical protein